MSLEVVALRFAQVCIIYANAVLQVFRFLSSFLERNKAVGTAAGENEWLMRYPDAIFKQQRDIAVSSKRLERARDLAQVAQNRPSFRLLLQSSPVYLD